MSSSQRLEGNRVYCHVCEHEWDRDQGGLQCPACESEFVEIVEANRSNSPPPPPPTTTSPNPFHDHNPWAPDPDEDDITTFEFNTGGSRGTVSYTTRTYTFGGGGGGGGTANVTMSRDIAANELTRNFETMLGNIMGFNPRTRPTMMGGLMQMDSRTETTRNTHGPPPDLFSMLFQNSAQQREGSTSALDWLGAMLNPANARRGDTVFSQEAFDQIMTQLMEQNQTSSAPGPASENAIASLRKKPVDETMMGNDGKAECSICMDGVEIGQEVTILPCNHWFHGDCVASWLREHDTCPHCRAPITNPDETSRPTTTRRSTRRRSSSVASPLTPIHEGLNRHRPTPDSPSGLRDARSRYYGQSRTSDPTSDRPSSERRSSDRSRRSSDNGGGGGGGGGGGVTGWIRNRLPFSG